VQVAFQRWSKDGRLGKEAVSVTCLARQTLMDLKYVSGRFEISRRREKLSLSHHREVAPKPLEEQDDWLDAGRSARTTTGSVCSLIPPESLVLRVAGRTAHRLERIRVPVRVQRTEEAPCNRRSR